MYEFGDYGGGSVLLGAMEWRILKEILLIEC